jgi:hypothetical protein
MSLSDPQAPYGKPTERAPMYWYRNNLLRSADEYVDDLRDEFRYDEVIAGVVRQAFISGRYGPAHELADLQAKIASGELITKAEHERLMEEEYQRDRDNPPSTDSWSGR